MFDDLTREIGRFDGAMVSVPIPIDDDGYLDRDCPSGACQFGFKVLEADWLSKVDDEEVFCPFYCHSAPANEWNT